MKILYLVSLLFTANSVLCTNFRSVADSHKSEDIQGSENSSEVVQDGLPEASTHLGDDSHETQSLKSLESIILEQEKPVLLNTIPQTRSSHILFVNSTGLFTNVTVELTATIPIAVVSPNNDSIHRILSNRKADSNTTDILEKVMNSDTSVSRDVDKMIEKAFEFIGNVSTALGQSNSTISEEIAITS